MEREKIWRKGRLRAADGRDEGMARACAHTYVPPPPHTTGPALPAYLRCLPPLCPLFIISSLSADSFLP